MFFCIGPESGSMWAWPPIMYQTQPLSLVVLGSLLVEWPTLMKFFGFWPSPQSKWWDFAINFFFFCSGLPKYVGMPPLPKTMFWLPLQKGTISTTKTSNRKSTLNLAKINLDFKARTQNCKWNRKNNQEVIVKIAGCCHYLLNEQSTFINYFFKLASSSSRLKV